MFIDETYALDNSTIRQLRLEITFLENAVYDGGDPLPADDRFEYSMRLTLARQELAAALDIELPVFQDVAEDDEEE